MKKKVLKYLSLLRVGVLEEMQFRLGAAVRLFGNIIYLIIIYFLWKAIFDSSPTEVVNGMTFADTMIYLVLASALFSAMEMYVTWQMGRSVQSGNIVMDLLRPMGYTTYNLLVFSGNTLVSVFVNLVPTMLIVYFITGGGFALSWNLLFFAIAVFIGTILNFFINFFVGVICFYTESIWGINIMKEVIVMLLSGASIPLAFFPEKLQQIVYYLPFQAIYNTPLTLLISRELSVKTGVSMLGIQIFWLVIMGVISNLFFRISVRRITVNGG